MHRICIRLESATAQPGTIHSPIRILVLIAACNIIFDGSRESIFTISAIHLLPWLNPRIFLNEIVGLVMKKCSVLLPGVDELLLLTEEKTVEAAVDKVLGNGVTEIVALKQGKKGCRVFTKDGSFSLGVYAVNTVDPTGAGDSFDAGFLCGLLEKKDTDRMRKFRYDRSIIKYCSF